MTREEGPVTQPLLQTPATPAAGSTTTFEGSIALSVAGHTYTLTGTLGDALIVEYHADFDQAISLGLVGTSPRRSPPR